MTWNSGTCGGEEPVELPAPIEPKENVSPERDDEPLRWPSMGATHFPTYLVNQREYPRRSRGTARD